MNKRFLGLLLMAAIFISLGAVWAVYHNQRDEGSLSEGDLVLPGLQEQLADVSQVQITTAGATAPYTLQHTDAGWVVVERYNYPANFNKIRTLLDQISNAKFYEPKTSTPANYVVLGVADITDKNNPGVLVDVFAKNKPEPYRLLIGKLATTWDGSYARIPGQAQSWLLDRQVPADSNITAWLNNSVLAIEPVRIYKVTYSTPKGENLIVAKNDRNTKRFTVENLPAGKAVRYDTVADGVARDFENIVLRDVQPATQLPFNPTDQHTVKLETYDGLIVDIQLQKTDGRYYLALQTHYDPELVNKTGATDAQLVSQVTGEAEAVQKRATGWLYEVNEHVYVDLTKTMKDVLPEVEDKNSKEEKPVIDEHAH
jgi:hypothetical protein